MLNELNHSQENKASEPPRPLVREVALGTAFPVHAMGTVLADAALAIHDKTHAPLAMCASSVLAAASLAAQSHADVVMPTAQVKPLSLFLITLADSGERKTGVDGYALQPVREQEARLRGVYESEQDAYRVDRQAYDAAKAKALGGGQQKGVAERKAALLELGPEPVPPLVPLLTVDEPTSQGLLKLLAVGQPSVGLFSAEGGLFIGGHALREDDRLQTAATLALAWDGEPLRRVRVSEEAMILPGRRLAFHLMVQAEIAGSFITDPQLSAQGLLARILITSPESTAGTRFWRDPKPESALALQRYNLRLENLLRQGIPLAPGKRNELKPRRLEFTDSARLTWISFSDEVERHIGANGHYEPIRAFAAKAAEHAARISGVLTLIGEPQATNIDRPQLEGAIEIMRHFINETLRLTAAGLVPADLAMAQKLLHWLLNNWTEPMVSLPDIYQLGPNAIRSKDQAAKSVNILVDHGYLSACAEPVEIRGQKRKQAWRVYRQSEQPIPQGSNIWLSPYLMHRHRKYYSNPEAFRPERFLNGEMENTPKYAYFPFAAGPRGCVGEGFAWQELMTITTLLCRKFSFELAPGQRVEPVAKISIQPSDGMHMLVIKR